MNAPPLTCVVTREPCDASAILCSCVACGVWCRRNVKPLTTAGIKAALAKGYAAAESCCQAMAPGPPSVTRFR